MLAGAVDAVSGPDNGDLNPATLNCQALAALRTASVDDLAATRGLHANAKAMGALAAGNGRLVSAFHVGLTWVKTDRAA
ncbi:hypothetical protein AXG89_05890 [Burkholderia sp. PAMC 26561]|jgi:hypothetical protein|nr:hypothetical protein AXG89_05890 [Burkholderia sp. PAMC 26561]